MTPRILLTGAAGFVGSNFAAVFTERHGAELVTPSHAELDLRDREGVGARVAAAAPSAIVHAAIWNDPAGLRSNRRLAWDSYVEATRNLVDAANAAGAQIVLISTDWVFDGTQGPAQEDAPPNPINTYGFLKAMSEQVVRDRAERGTVARLSGVQGIPRARPDLPRSQDAGFGYLVASLVRELSAGRPFTLWDGPGLNLLATPTLATDAGELVWRAVEREVTGTLHCCGADHVHRADLARRACALYGLDASLLRTGPPPAGALGREPVPVDTRLASVATAERLGISGVDLDTMLARLGRELATSAA
ncbi:MAG TPA: sugar nucleotide-binding protein [Solirubrobacteraceae bacterium]|nr:sugar nucleotide-binding protein [Solirubrobacteraceae bacterium]